MCADPFLTTLEDIDMIKRQTSSAPHHQARGTVKLLDQNTVILIPTPSPDPKGNYNMQQTTHH